MYATLKATVRDGKIRLLDQIALPENSNLLVTVLDDHLDSSLTLGDHLIAGLEDILQGRVTTISTPQELTQHLDTLFNEE
ncbi:MAG: hypothetical protein ACPGWR_14050 [Ardenticatenaceae bacterium]